MEHKFKINVNNYSHFDFDLKEVESLDMIKENQSKYHLIHNNKSVNIQILDSDIDSNLYKISLNSTVYQIKIETPLNQLIKKLGFSLGNAKKLNQIKSPMPGIIIEINAKKGDVVNEGDTLLILEAMKMENSITSPKSGKIKNILVINGATVEKNKLLIELE